MTPLPPLPRAADSGSRGSVASGGMGSTRAVVVRRTGGREVLEVDDVDLADPGPGEVAVEVAAAGVNFIDVYLREGRYPRPLPFVVGGEGAGTVTELGPGVDGVAVGDVVAWADGSRGSQAAATVVAAREVVPVPAGLDPGLAAAVLLQGMTAHYLVTSTHEVRPGQWALVHAAAGGVGQLLVQLVKARGAHVVATVSTAAKAEIARAHGADDVIVYAPEPDTDELAARIRAATGGRGVDVAYDGVGRSTFEASLAATAPRGTIALFGASSGPVPPFDLQRLNGAGSLFVTRPTLAHHTATREELTWRASAVLDAVAAGSLHVDVGGRYGLDDVRSAYADLEGRRTTGKLLVVP